MMSFVILPTYAPGQFQEEIGKLNRMIGNLLLLVYQCDLGSKRDVMTGKEDVALVNVHTKWPVLTAIEYIMASSYKHWLSLLDMLWHVGRDNHQLNNAYLKDICPPLCLVILLKGGCLLSRLSVNPEVSPLAALPSPYLRTTSVTYCRKHAITQSNSLYIPYQSPLPNPSHSQN